MTSIGNEAFYACDSLLNVYYAGTPEEWDEITIEKGNNDLKNATKHFNHEHDYVCTVIEPNCYMQGYTLQTCKRCEEENKINWVPALEHIMSEWEQADSPNNDYKWIRYCIRENEETGYDGYYEVSSAETHP